MIQQPIHALADAYRRGDLTPTAVAEAYLARIDALDGRVRAYLTIVREQALAAARESERRCAPVPRSARWTARRSRSRTCCARGA